MSQTKTLRPQSLTKMLGAIATVALGLSAPVLTLEASAATKVKHGYKTIENKSAQIDKLHAHVSTIMTTLDRNPKGLSTNSVKSLRLRARAFEREGLKAIEAGTGELRFSEDTAWGQVGASLATGKGAGQRYRSISIASSAESTALTEAVVGQGRKTLQHNQMVSETTRFPGGGRRVVDTALRTSATYEGGGYSTSLYLPGQKPAGKAGKQYFGSTLTMGGDTVERDRFVQSRGVAGKFSTGRTVYSKETVSKKSMLVSWDRAGTAANEAAAAVNAIVTRGPGASVNWSELDAKLGAILASIDQASSAVRDGAEIFAEKGGSARAPRMAPLVKQGNLTLQSLSQARARVLQVYETVHDRLGFSAGAELSKLLGDHSAPTPKADGTIPEWVTTSLGKAAGELSQAQGQSGRGGDLLRKALAAE